MTMTTTDGSGRRVSISTRASTTGVRLLLTIYPRTAWAGRIEKASAHLHLELTPDQARELITGLSEYLCPKAAGEAGDEELAQLP